MKFKKFIAVFLCVLMGLTLFSACGDGAGMDFGGLFDPNEEVDPYPLDTKVGFIYNSEVGTNPLNAIFEIGRDQLERTLGAETCYMENVRLTQFEEAAERLIANGCDVIVAASSVFNSAVVLTARKYTDVYFISFGGSDQAPNLASIQPLLYQAANVSGLIAAYNTNSNQIGIVADSGMYNAYGVANAFALGVRELNYSQIDLHLNWALSVNFHDTRAAVLDLVEQGCDIIFVYQSEDFATWLCEELGVTVIGFGYNVPDIAPENYLTGIYMNLNSFLIDKVRNYMYGNTAAFGDHVRRGLHHGTVSWLGINNNIALQGSWEIAELLTEQIKDERSTIFGGEIRDRDNVVRVEKGTVMMVQQIFTIKWLASNIVTEKNFSEPQTELVYSDFTIRK